MRSLDDLTMYAYGLLDEPAAKKMAGHLEGCKKCAELARRIAAERRLFTTAFAREAPKLPAWAIYPWP